MTAYYLLLINIRIVSPLRGIPYCIRQYSTYDTTVLCHSCGVNVVEDGGKSSEIIQYITIPVAVRYFFIQRISNRAMGRRAERRHGKALNNGKLLVTSLSRLWWDYCYGTTSGSCTVVQ